MSAVDIERATIEKALLSYQQQLQSQHEAQLNNLPRHGKSVATAEDSSREAALESELRAITAVLNQQRNREPATKEPTPDLPAKPLPPPLPTVTTLYQDVVNTEPYINPFSGQWIYPVTPDTAGPSTLEKTSEQALLSATERSKQIIDAQSKPMNNSAGRTQSSSAQHAPRVEKAGGGDIPEGFTPTQLSHEEMKTPHRTRSKIIIPTPRLYGSNVNESSADIPGSAWNPLSRVKKLASRGSFRSQSRNKPVGKEDGADTGLSQRIRVPDRVWPGFPKSAVKSSESSSPATSDSKTPSSYSSSDFSSRWSLILGTGTASIPKSDITTPSRDESATKQQMRIVDSLPSTKTMDSETYDIASGVIETPKGPELKASQKSTGMHSASYANIPMYQAPAGIPIVSSRHELQFIDKPENPGHWPEEESREYQESLLLAMELRGDVPQDYESLLRMQEENEKAVQDMESWRLAMELSQGAHQDFGILSQLQHQNDNLLNQLKSFDMEAESRFAADRRLALSLAEDTPQDMESLIRSEATLRSKLQEESRLAQEIAERADQADLQADLEAIRQMQDEWNAQDDREILEQQNLARMLSEEEDRSELEGRIAECQAIQEEWSGSNWDVVQNDSASITIDGNQPWSIPPSSQPPSYTEIPPFQEIPPLRQEQRAIPGAYPSPQASDNSHDINDAIAERRQRQSQWESTAAQNLRAAKAEADSIRRLEAQARDHAERLRQQAELRRREEDARRAAAEADRRARQAECTVCGDASDRAEMAVLPCSHAYDANCIRDAFAHALSSKKPFSCCKGTRVPVDAVGSFLDAGFVAAYNGMLLERDTPHPVYCSRRRCSAFIPPAAVRGDQATCAKCQTVTCRLCRRQWHEGVCKEDVDGQALLQLAKKSNWQACSQCKTMVERSEGCPHMTCRCGYQFCYNCGKRWNSCDGTRCQRS